MALIDPIIHDEGFVAPPPVARPVARTTNILDPGFDLTLRPMRYPRFFEMYKDSIKNTWTVDEIDFSDDLVDLDRKLIVTQGWVTHFSSSSTMMSAAWSGVMPVVSMRISALSGASYGLSMPVKFFS